MISRSLACLQAVAFLCLLVVPRPGPAAELQLKLAEQFETGTTPTPGPFARRLEESLVAAGHHVVASGTLLVHGTATASATGGAGAFHSQARCGFRALEKDTGKIVATFTTQTDADAPTAEAAETAALELAADRAGAALVDALRKNELAPGQPRQLMVTVGGVKDYAELSALKAALGKVAGVSSVNQREFKPGTSSVLLDVECSCDGVTLAAALPPELVAGRRVRVDKSTPGTLVLSLEPKGKAHR